MVKVKAVCTIGALALDPSRAEGYSEVLWILHGFAPLKIRPSRIGHHTILHIFLGEKLLEYDVKYGLYGDLFTLRLFLPSITYKGTKIIEKYINSATKKLFMKTITDLILEFGEVSYNIVFKPEFFIEYILCKKQRPYGVVDILIMEYVRDLRKTLTLLETRLYEVLREMANKRILIETGKGLYKINSTIISNTLKRPYYTLGKIKITVSEILLNIMPKVNLDVLLKSIIQYSPHPFSLNVNPYTKLYVALPNGEIRPIEWKVKETRLHPIARLGSSVLNDIIVAEMEKKVGKVKVVIKKYREVREIKWIPVTLWLGFKENFTPDPLERMAREFYTTHILRKHGFKVPMIHHVKWAERAIIREYIEGKPLSTLIAEKKIEVLNELYRNVGEITAKIHNLHLSIGDYKPSNMIIKNGQEIYLIDLEQSSTRRDISWDIIEFMSFTAINAKYRWNIIKSLFHSFIEGYVGEGGDIGVVERAFRPKYIRIFTPLVPVNILVKLKSEVKRWT